MSFWSGRRVLVTGHTGFKGGWLSLRLQALGAEVTGVALDPPTEPALYRVAHVAQGMRSLRADVRDADAMRAIVAASAPEVVFHLAAQPLVRASYVTPVETFDVNVMGTIHVLEAVRTVATVRSVVCVTSDKCYENREWPWGYRETESLGGADPYSASKAAAEVAIAAWRRSFLGDRTAVASVRAGNVIGGGDWALDRLVPDVIGAFAAGCPARIRRPLAERPWQHVLEPLDGYLRLAERLAIEGQGWADAWNFGPDERDARPVREVVDALARAWGDGASWQHEPEPADAPHEAAVLRLDSARARRRLGWEPRWPLDEALARTVAWERARLAGADMRAETLRQIADHDAGRSLSLHALTP